MKRAVKQGITRRDFVRMSSVVGIGFLGLLTSCSKGEGIFSNFIDDEAPFPLPSKIVPSSIYGYGPLYPQENGILELPKGFSYEIISKLGSLMDDGFYVPGSPDGMASFSGSNGKTILIMNHEMGMGTNN
ncbi:MAG: PhoX family protein, partial [Bacteroidota bacterium]|nr:PhoX family protein [Bacteroidota bacterium]